MNRYPAGVFRRFVRVLIKQFFFSQRPQRLRGAAYFAPLRSLREIFLS
jgi:hypothetical protein